jgi:hypothetical protein
MAWPRYQAIKFSVVTPQVANKLFLKQKSNPDLPFDYAKDGQYARTYVMNNEMAKDKYVTGNVYVLGHLWFHSREFGELGLGYQVSPVILVNAGSKITPYVIDPGLMAEPQPYEKFLAIFTRHTKTKVEEETFTSGRCYNVTDREFAPDPSNMSVSDHQDQLEDAVSENAKFTDMLVQHRAKLKSANKQ